VDDARETDVLLFWGEDAGDDAGLLVDFEVELEALRVFAAAGQAAAGMGSCKRGIKRF